MFSGSKDISKLLSEVSAFSPLLTTHKISESDYAQILSILKRAPNTIELGIFSAMWSEHCSYKSSKKYLRGFPTSALWVVQGPGENAGAIDIGGNLAAVFKIESHNHPSFIEPHAGAATGVGGIMRDIFTMGARPVASLNSIRFGDILSQNNRRLHTHLLRGVVEGIGSYGNCMGVPTIGGETSFESCYNGNILVNAFCLGLVKKDKIFYANAKGVGNPVIYVGSKTGRDGLGGAVMSSDSFSSKEQNLRPTVQVGDPFAEKLLLEACLELFEQDYIIGIQDMGAAGLTSSSFEMAQKSGSGMRLDLDKVPMRETQMNPYELMLSESQERMLICAKKGFERKVIEIFEKWEVDVAIIGEVTDSGQMELFWHGNKCAQIPINELVENAPMLDRELKAVDRESEAVNGLRTNLNANEIFKKLLSSIEIADKKWIYSQYDSSVQTNSMVVSGASDASVIRIKGADSEKGANKSANNGADSEISESKNEIALAMQVFCDTRYCYLNPLEGAKISVATAGRKCALRGTMPKAISDCLNFGSPNNAEVMWEFAQVCEGIKQACEILKTPVVSGNVSLHNQTDGIDIYPTPSIVAVGVGESKGVKTSKLGQSGLDSVILLAGEFKPNFAGSLAQKIIEDRIYGAIPRIDLHKERTLWEFLQSANSEILSAKNVGYGGVAIAIAKMAILGNVGVQAEIQNLDSENEIFAQSAGCVLLEVAMQSVDSVIALAKAHGVQIKQIGKVTKEKNIKINSVQVSLQKAYELYFDSFENKIFN